MQEVLKASWILFAAISTNTSMADRKSQLVRCLRNEIRTKNCLEEHISHNVDRRGTSAWL
ncbi:unnamed protein product [Strongylus vulgaris]|uniref:Uncharacterized protein n=1 Tax=Strongylus vulgaris TaxID=40348 RepID=A0A3P7K1V0_STRVU|nr:unnamed protein product [Strongylus vulgaris]